MMKYQVTILLLAGVVAYANAAITNDVPTLELKTAGGDALAVGSTVYVGDTIKLTCTIAPATAADPVDKAEFLRAAVSLGTQPGTEKTLVLDYILVDGDMGDASSFTCKFHNGATEQSQPSAAKTLKVVAATTTAAPTTTGGGGDGKSGAGSNSPVMAIFLISIAAMCF